MFRDANVAPPGKSIERPASEPQLVSHRPKGYRVGRRGKEREHASCIVLEGLRRDTPIRELCRREGIRPGTYYAWLKDFMEAGKERLTRDTARDATRSEVNELKRENARLKTLVAELSLQVHVLKKTAVPELE